MKKLSLIVTVFIAILYFTKPVSAQILTVDITGGKVEGIFKDEIASFKGIPFAAPPVGNLRWKAPQPVIPWEGVKKADVYGPTPMQDKQTAKMLALSPNISEDCLHLNVWTGAKSPDEKRPVMVWIYGGGFVGGASNCPLYDGGNYARKGIVFVTINYRLGAFGFLAHPELSKESGKGSGCYGIQDQVAALKWVKENIGAFGGNPENVTIFGQSAGSFSVSILSAVPAAKGLFQRIISESGSYMAPLKYANEAGTFNLSLKKAEQDGKTFLSELGAENIGQARMLSAEKIQAAVPGIPVFKFWPVADGVTIPGDLYIQYLAGNFNDVPVIIGTNSDEGAGFVQPSQVLNPEGFEKTINENYGPAAKAILKVYPHASEKETLKSQKDIWRESLFGWPAWAWANLHAKKSKNKTYVYYFDVHSDKSPDGAPHSAEVPYVFLFKYGINGGRPTETDKTVMDMMGSYWINFAKTGNPNGQGLPVWPAYNQKNMKTMIFDTASSARPLPNIEKDKAFDEYFKWRRKQNKGKD
jgi:para-nitrobenzyl esterase